MTKVKAVLANSRDSTVYDEPVPVFAKRLRQAIRIDCVIAYPDTISEEELVELSRDADVIVGGMGISISMRVLEAASRLRLLQTTGAGVEKMPFDYLKRRGVYLSNTSGANAVAVAEHALTLMLMLAKKAIVRHELLRRGIWERSKSIELYGKTIGIVGLGSIGTELARRAGAFGMHIVAIKRHPSANPAKGLSIDSLGGPDDLDALLKKSDFVVLTVPSTPETLGLIGERELRLMKNSAFIINVSRGNVIQEEPLCRALKDNWIAGAGIDTWWGFVPNVPSKLGIHELDNVVATSHVGGQTEEFLENLTKTVVENIEKISRGEKPLNLVDLDLRY